MINALMAAGLVSTSFFLKFSQRIDVRFGHQAWLLIFFVVACVFINSKIKRSNYLLLYFIPAGFLLPKDLFSHYAFFHWLLTSLGIVFYLKISSINLNREFLHKIFIFLCLSQSLWVFLEYFNVDLYGMFLGLFGEVKRMTDVGKTFAVVDKKSITGSLGHPMLSASYIAILLPFVYKFKKYLIAIPLLAIYLTGSAMGAVTAYVGLFYVFTHHFRYRIHLIFMHFVALVSLVYHGYQNGGFFSDSARIDRWWYIIKHHALDNPIFGGGPSYIRSKMLNIGGEVFTNEHNEFLTLFFQYGLVGIAIMIIIAKYKMLEFKKEKDAFFKASLIALLFNCTGSFPLHIGSTGLIFLVLAGQLNKKENIYGSII